MATTVTSSKNVTAVISEERRASLRRKKIRDFFQGLFSHAIINFVGLFFLIPFVWMLVTSVKSDQDVFHTPPRWLPYDNVTVNIGGQQLPLYNVRTENGTKQLALVKIVEGTGTFVDPQNPAQELQYEIQQGTTKIAEPIMHISFRWRNFPDAMERGSRPGVGASFWVYFKNSLIIAFFTILGTLLSNTPVAYAFARINFPGRDLLFIIVLATLMLPYQVTIIPLYLFFNDYLHWGNSFLPLLVPAFFANAWDVFLLRQFFKTIPEEMCDAARVDGASEWQIFTRIVLPLSAPAIVTLVVVNGLWVWNELLIALVFLPSDDLKTLTVGVTVFQNKYNLNVPVTMAGMLLASLPMFVVYLVGQRFFVRGLTAGAVKG